MLKGIDNDTTAVVKMQDQLNKKTQNIIQTNGLVKELVNGISNAALATPEPLKAKPVKAAPPPKPVKTAKPVKTSAKPVKTATVKPAKAAAKKPAKSNGTKNGGSVSIDERPPLRQLLTDLISGKQSVKSSDVYHQVEDLASTGGFEVWSRQSVYSLLKKLVSQNEIVKVGEGPDAVYSLPTGQNLASDDEADRLITKVEGSSAIASVQ